MLKLFGSSNVQLDYEKTYRLGRVIGTTEHSSMKLAENKIEKKMYVMKTINITNRDEEEEAVIREINILQQFFHENIITLQDSYFTEQHIYMVLELMRGGDLFERIIEKEFFSEEVAKETTCQMLAAIAYCHEANVVHRDIKPENFLYLSDNSNSILKLSDFNMAVMLKPSELVYITCGTPGYIAPESIPGKISGYGREVDLWALGVTVYICLCGYPPYYSVDDAELFTMIETTEILFPPPIWDNISSCAKDFVLRLLCRPVSERHDVKQALEHPFITGAEFVTTQSAAQTTNSLMLRRKFRAAVTAVRTAQTVTSYFTGPGSINNQNKTLPYADNVAETNKGDLEMEDAELDVDSDLRVNIKPKSP